MSSNEARQIVQFGLDRKKADRKARIQERQLEQYEMDMIQQLNIHCADAKKDTASRARQEERRAAQAEAARKARELDEKAQMAVQRYGRACIGILLLVGFTSFPWWAALTLTLGLAVFPTAYIFRLYCPGEVRA